MRREEEERRKEEEEKEKERTKDRKQMGKRGKERGWKGGGWERKENVIMIMAWVDETTKGSYGWPRAIME